jgi:hypothetical protein
MMTQVWKLYLDSSEVREYIELNKSPLISVDSVQYYDAENALQTLNANQYERDIVGDPCRIRVPSWPTVYDRMNAVCITFTCGYDYNIGEPVLATSVGLSPGIITKNDHGLANGSIVKYTNVGTITNITMDTLYYVVNRTVNTYQISSSLNGDPVVFTGTTVSPPTYQNVGKVPEAMKHAIKLILAHLFIHREDVLVAVSGSVLPNGSKELLESYKNNWYYPSN